MSVAIHLIIFKIFWLPVIIELFHSINQLFWHDPWAQSLGFIAMLVGVSAFFQTDDQKLKYFLTIFTLLMAIHFFMLGQDIGGYLALLGSVRNYISSKTNNIWVMNFFILAAVILAIPNFESWVHILPPIGVIAGTWGLFRAKGATMRAFMSCGTMCWLTHNIMIGSMGGILIEGIFLIINFRTIYILTKKTEP